MAAVLISPEELRNVLSDSDRRVHLLDVRWALGDPDGPEHYLEGHIPGAVFVDLETELAAPPSPAHGRHPLPAPEHLQRCARSWGLRTGELTVVYDATGGMSAARAWWLLCWAGIDDVRILDGGLPAWQHSGGQLARGSESDPVAGDVVVKPGNMPVVQADEVAAWSGALLDARAGERYRGQVEPIDPRAGHIPGAVSVPTSDNLTSEGRFKSPEQLRERFSGLGPGPVAVYCGSGVTAAHQIAALSMAGVAASLYPGSWSQWSSDPERPVATALD